MVVLGMANSRMKDYFDVLSLLRETRMDSTTLAQAVVATFERRETPVPVDLPIGLSKAFASDASKQRQWSAFLARSRLRAPRLEEVVDEIGDAVASILKAIAAR
jgi:hypothetical protein